jgi:hypothetical protein
MSENILDKAKTAALSIKERAADLKADLWNDEKAEIVNEFKEKGTEKIKEILEIVNKYKSLFYEAGYEVDSFNASLSIPPDISITFIFLGAINGDKKQEIKSKVSESKIASIILSSLFKASDFAEKIKMGEMKLKEIEITLGLIPGISISLT